MAEQTQTKLSECDDLGSKIALEVTPHYLKVILGRETYYFDKETGNFDGTSYQVSD